MKNAKPDTLASPKTIKEALAARYVHDLTFIRHRLLRGHDLIERGQWKLTNREGDVLLVAFDARTSFAFGFTARFLPTPLFYFCGVALPSGDIPRTEGNPRTF